MDGGSCAGAAAHKSIEYVIEISKSSVEGLAGDGFGDGRFLSVFGAEGLSGKDAKKQRPDRDLRSIFDRCDFNVGQKVKHMSQPGINFIVIGRMMTEGGVFLYSIQTVNLGGQMVSYDVREESLTT